MVPLSCRSNLEGRYLQKTKNPESNHPPPPPPTSTHCFCLHLLVSLSATGSDEKTPNISYTCNLLNPCLIRHVDRICLGLGTWGLFIHPLILQLPSRLARHILLGFNYVPETFAKLIKDRWYCTVELSYLYTVQGRGFFTLPPAVWEAPGWEEGLEEVVGQHHPFHAVGFALTHPPETRSRVHEHTILLRFLGIILGVLRLEVSI